MIFEADQDLKDRPRLFSDAFVSEPLIGRDIYIYPIKSTVSYRHFTPSAVAELVLLDLFLCAWPAGAHLWLGLPQKSTRPLVPIQPIVKRSSEWRRTSFWGKDAIKGSRKSFKILFWVCHGPWVWHFGWYYEKQLKNVYLELIADQTHGLCQKNFFKA